jgi:hypothetical protein
MSHHAVGTRTLGAKSSSGRQNLRLASVSSGQTSLSARALWIVKTSGLGLGSDLIGD